MVLCVLRKIQTSVSMFKRGWGAGCRGQDVVFKELKVFSLEKRRYREKKKVFFERHLCCSIVPKGQVHEQ